jgi:hypothetical protein
MIGRFTCSDGCLDRRQSHRIESLPLSSGVRSVKLHGSYFRSSSVTSDLCRHFRHFRRAVLKRSLSTTPSMCRTSTLEPAKQRQAVVTERPSRYPVPPENRIRLLDCGFAGASGGSAVFIDQPVHSGFPADSPGIEVDRCDAGSFAPIARNPPGDALMRPCRSGPIDRIREPAAPGQCASPSPVPEPAAASRVHVHRRDRPGGILHEYRHAA